MENLKEIASNTLGILTILVVVELIGYFTWNKHYFRSGIPVFIRTLSVSATTTALPSVQDMESRCPSSFWGPSIRFKEIGQGEYAFREGRREGVFLFFGVTYPPAIRGYLVYDSSKKQIRVKGYVVLIYPLVIFGAFSYAAGWELALILLGVFFGIPYLIQSARYNAVAKVAAGLCTGNSAQKNSAG